MTSNFAGGAGSMVVGGSNNGAEGTSSLVVGGFDNRATVIDSLIVGGAGNRATGARAIVVGGGSNLASGQYSFIGGGGRQSGTGAAGANAQDNVASNNGSTVVGGMGNRATGVFSFVGGGGGVGLGNTASGGGSTVAGGYDNLASRTQSFIGGGYLNVASALNSSVPGGFNNTAAGSGSVAMGWQASALHNNSFVFSDGSPYSSAAANSFNIRAAGNVNLATNTKLDFGSQTRQMIQLWGGPNSYGIGIQGGTQYYRVDAGAGNVTGFAWFRGGVHSDTSLDPGAGGIRVMTLSRDGQLVLPQTLQQQIRIGDDAAGGDVIGIGAQNFMGYARSPLAGGFGFYRGGTHVVSEANPGVGGEVLVGVFKTGDGSFLQTAAMTGTVRALSFVVSSDRAAKSGFAPVNAKAILANVASLPVTSWTYNAEKGSGVRHIGPVAQDFVKAFKVGYDDKTIDTIDAAGIAFAAIKGLNQLMEEKDAKISKLERELAQIKNALGIK